MAWYASKNGMREVSYTQTHLFESTNQPLSAIQGNCQVRNPARGMKEQIRCTASTP